MTVAPVRILCPAKLNWVLSVGPRRADNYHDVSTVMQAIDWHDVLTLQPHGTPLAAQPNLTLTITGTADGVTELADAAKAAPSHNLIGQAHALYQQHSPLPLPPLSVHLQKHIPMQAGLGGGSSNAAAMLYGLNTLCDTPLPNALLLKLAGQLGADVAFFMHRYLHPEFPVLLATGKGETITPVQKLDGLPPCHVWVVKPRTVAMATPEAYRWLDADRRESIPTHTNKTLHADSETCIRALQHWAKNPSDLAAFNQWQQSFTNDFQTGLCRRYPAMADLEKRLCKGIYPETRPNALLAGSGSAMAAILVNSNLCLQESETETALKARFSPEHFEHRLCKTLTNS